jgi:pimeloyl-ACP methyl ester carboxylesterase
MQVTTVVCAVKCKPHHVVGPGGNIVLGWSHFGMLASARWIHSEAAKTLNDFLEGRPDWELLVVGHSLGGGTAALLCTLCAPLSLGLR